MELQLTRIYHPKGTNGLLRLNGELFCYTIELPWDNNKRNKSCIPEGRYRIEKRYSDHFKAHMLVAGVPERSLILIHPANDAAMELRGCIAPVKSLTGQGTGTESREPFHKLRSRVYAALEKNDEVWLTIQAA